MGKKLFNLMDAMHLQDPPLVYLHQHFKKQNKSSLKNNWVWFSEKDLRNILAAIKQIEKDEPSKTGDGVRLYYGVYNNRVCEYLDKLPKPESEKKKNVSYKDHEGHNTIFFVPTYTGANEDEHIDVITATSSKKIKEDYDKDLPIPLPALWAGGYDVGQICPPPTNCTGSGSNL